MNISGVGEMGVGKTGVGEMGQIIGKTGVGETGTSHLHYCVYAYVFGFSVAGLWFWYALHDVRNRQERIEVNLCATYLSWVIYKKLYVKKSVWNLRT